MHVLLAVDTSDATRKAVDFVGRTLASAKDVRVTVLHVVDSLPDHFLFGAAREKFRGMADVLEQSARESGGQLLDEVRTRLAELGIAEARVDSRLQVVESLPESRRVTAAMGIVASMQEGEYDVVCVGRRGTSAAEGSFIGSVAQHVLREARGVTVWVVD